MPATYDGQTIADYAISGATVTPGTYTVSESTIASDCLSLLRNDFDAAVEILPGQFIGSYNSQMGTPAINSFELFQNIVPNTIALRLSTIKDTVPLVGTKTESGQWTQKTLQKDYHEIADLALQVGAIAHKTAHEDRKRVDVTTHQTSKHVWQTAESVIDRAAEVTSQNTHQTSQTAVKLLLNNTLWEKTILQCTFDGWKNNMCRFYNLTGDMSTIIGTYNCPIFWHPTDGTLTTTGY